MVYKIVFLRHGESVWNVANIFTGWADVDLSEAGKLEAISAGQCLKEKGYKFDIVFTSVLRRAIKTAWTALMESENFTMPVINTWRLNERHYGGLQGLNKGETAKKYGDDQVKIWRRSFDVPPPLIETSDKQHPCNDPLYASVPQSALPGAESLKLTIDRVLPFWHDHIAPCVMAGKMVLVAAHGNSLRALCKYIEDMSEKDVLELNIPTAVPLVYELDDKLCFVKKYYLMDPDEVAAKMAAVAAQGSAAPAAGPTSATAYKSLGNAVTQMMQHPTLKALDTPFADLSGASDFDAVKSITLAFLKSVAGDASAEAYLGACVAAKSKFSELGSYYVLGIDRIKTEIAEQCGKDASLEAALTAITADNAQGSIKGAEAFWKVFFPVGVGMLDNAETKMAALKKQRGITDLKVNPNPIKDPVSQMLFTSNVLLGLPADSTPIAGLPYTDDFKSKLTAASKEAQVAWFDHPIQIGVAPDGNEILYGLKGLDVAVAWEKEKGNIPADATLLTALSMTCTHVGLQNIAKQYVEEEFKAMPADAKLKHLKILLFSEIETDMIVNEVIKPALAKIGKESETENMRIVFGVEGQYGRHYTFLKAILAVYNSFVDSNVRATFKIDIDQLFIQESLMAETGSGFIEHFKTDLWGATGKNWRGEDVELGMIAGALCNQNDWEASGKKLFVADVKPPKADKVLTADELIFFSGLPQAISTEAEMMTKYSSNADVIQRIHVTGGTNGILVDTLFKFKPFAPSWIGRAEDQSYIYSVIGKPGPKLAYVHKPGLIMRHDKEAFAMEAMEAAKIGKMVGDYERMLLFSEYATVCAGDLKYTKDLVDPFTGCFSVPTPYTTTFLRFACKTLGFAAAGAQKDTADFALMGAPRVAKIVQFVKKDGGGKSELQKSYEEETRLWAIFYEAMTAAKGDAAISAAAKKIIDGATAVL